MSVGHPICLIHLVCLLCRDGVVKIWLCGAKTASADVLPQCGLTLNVRLLSIDKLFIVTSS